MVRIGKSRFRALPAVVAVCLVLTSAVVPAGPAAAAPCGTSCYRYQADITATASVFPSRVVPGGTHIITVQVTNTGWRTGGTTTPPMPWVGPDSGEVAVTTSPSTNDGQPLNDYYDGGVNFTPCWSNIGDNLTCWTASMPSGATGQFTLVWRAPPTPGTYTYRITINSYKWTEYNENNNVVDLTYDVGW